MNSIRMQFIHCQCGLRCEQTLTNNETNGYMDNMDNIKLPVWKGWRQCGCVLPIQGLYAVEGPHCEIKITFQMFFKYDYVNKLRSCEKHVKVRSTFPKLHLWTQVKTHHVTTTVCDHMWKRIHFQMRENLIWKMKTHEIITCDNNWIVWAIIGGK